MKYLLIFLISFNVYAQEKTYKIQVFRNSDNQQLYGLYAKEHKKAQRVKEAQKLHIGGETRMIVEDITQQLADEKQSHLDAIEERKSFKVLVNSVSDPIVRKILKRIVKDFY